VAVDRFFPGPPDTRGRGSPELPIRFAYPSRILAGKGQHVAIDALARMGRDHKARARLVIVGAASEPIYLDRLRIEAYHQPVDFYPDVSDMVPFYQACEAVVFPTLMEEGFGFTAVEGMACGKPVAWCDQPAIAEATGGIGLPVPRDDAEALKRAMVRLMDNPEERISLGAAGRAWVEARSWRRVWERYEAALERLCS
jgi:glycosyltransferase involved in cell wall biosynthesis